MPFRRLGKRRPEVRRAPTGLVRSRAESRSNVNHGSGPGGDGAVTHADVAVVGLGVIGLSTALALARRGVRVVALDRFGGGAPATPATGPPRSIRLAYEQPVSVGPVREADGTWRALEIDTGERI